MIRPVVVARYAQSRDFSAAASLCEQALQFNFALLSGLLAILVVDGGELVVAFLKRQILNRKCRLLICLLILFAFETQRLIVEVMSQVAERYDLMVPGNIFMSASVTGGIIGYDFIGAIAFPIANMLALASANSWCIYRLKTYGFKYTHDWHGTAGSFAIFVLLHWPV